MKYMTSFSMLALFSISNVYAETQSAYFEIEYLTTAIDAENNKGPFASAISDTGSDYALYATKANLDQDTDIGLPYTFNQPCFFNDDVCDFRFYGSENSDFFSYENAYHAWRNAMFDMSNGVIDPESYFLTETSDLGEVTGFGSDTDVKITDVYGF